MRTDITAAPQMKNASKHAKEGADEVAKRLDIIWDSIGQSEARKIMSEQHKLLAFRPPGDSLAAHAQLAAAKHPVSSDPMPVDILKRVAKVDAERILAQRNPTTADRQSPLLEIDVNMITKGDARLLMSFQHHALGYRPPPDSLAAKAQASIQRKSSSGSAAAEEQPIEETLLREAAYRDASRLKALRTPERTSDAATSEDTTEARHSPSTDSTPTERPSRARKHRRRKRPRRPRAPTSDPILTASVPSSSQSASGSDTLSPSPSTPPTSDTDATPPPPMFRMETSDSLEIIGDVLLPNSL